MEQATLVRRAKEPGIAPLREGVREPAIAPVREGTMSQVSTSPPRDGLSNVTTDLADDELQLLAEIATGVTTDVAARRLELSARTLRRRLRAVCDQLGVNTPIEAVVWAARRQLI